MTGINVDWTEANFEEWENETIRVLREVLEDTEHPQFKKVAERLGVLEDGVLIDSWEDNLSSYDPMINYAHILETIPSDDAVLEVALKTNCTIMYNTENDVYYIVLNGGGMDLSQDIGLAYVILENWMPKDFIGIISTQKGLSISLNDFETLRKAVIEQTDAYAKQFLRYKEDWTNA